MTEKKFAKALNKEKRRIQEALLSIGYYAYMVKFHPTGKGHLPRLEIEARAGGEEDRKLLG